MCKQDSLEKFCELCVQLFLVWKIMIGNTRYDDFKHKICLTVTFLRILPLLISKKYFFSSFLKYVANRDCRIHVVHCTVLGRKEWLTVRKIIKKDKRVRTKEYILVVEGTAPAIVLQRCNSHHNLSLPALARRSGSWVYCRQSRGRGWVSYIFVRRWPVLSLLSLIYIL